ncbi:hypothetical protein D3C86_1697090 [compost metagenome]
MRVFGARLYGRLHGREVVQQDHAVSAFDGFPGLECLAVEIDQRLDHMLAIEHHNIGLARLGYVLAGVDEIPDLILGWLINGNLGETKAGLVVGGILDDIHRRLDFVGA